MMDDLRKKSVNGITKKYNWDHVTDQYIETFNDLLKFRN